MGIKEEKQKLRNFIWNLLTEKKVAKYPLPCYGRIPNFEGSYDAAKKLAELEEWKRAKVITANPDFAQKSVRELALKQEKFLIMASPRLKHGYLLLEPEKVKGKEAFASTITGAFKLGKQVEKFPKPDLIITGCVAVDTDGNRLGKGGGYGDTEIGRIRKEFGYIKVATTVHDLQIVAKVPSEKHDQKVDIIVTPTRVIRIR
jgi:5-formyltetrahydrofolate cyclo-ligase